MAAVEASAAHFTEAVFLPAPKVRRILFEYWLDWTQRSGLPHGC